MRSHAQALQGALGLLPPGFAWSRSPDSVWGRTLAPLANEAVLFEQAAEAQLFEGTPSTADALLPDYERVLGPDPCVPALPASRDDRRRIVRSRWTSRRGAARRDYVEAAAALGFAVAIQEFAPSRFGDPFGTSFGGIAWAFAWQVAVTGPSGQDLPGNPFSPAGKALLDCTLNRLKPAHTVLLPTIYLTNPVPALWGIGRWSIDTWAVQHGPSSMGSGHG